MKIDPLLPQTGHSPFLQPAIVQRLLRNACSGHKPVTPVAARGFEHLCRMDSQPDLTEHRSLCLRLMGKTSYMSLQRFLLSGVDHAKRHWSDTPHIKRKN